MQLEGFGIDWTNLATWAGLALIPVGLVLVVMRTGRRNER